MKRRKARMRRLPSGKQHENMQTTSALQKRSAGNLITRAKMRNLVERGRSVECIKHELHLRNVKRGGLQPQTNHFTWRRSSG